MVGLSERGRRTDPVRLGWRSTGPMTVNSSEPERLEEQVLSGDRILHALYCGECAYSLKRLPYIGRCPECGGRYNAHPLKMEGIFLPQNMELPIAEICMLAVGLLISGSFIGNSITASDSGQRFIGILVLILSVMFAYHGWTKFAKYLRFRHLIKQIEAAEDE